MGAEDVYDNDGADEFEGPVFDAPEDWDPTEALTRNILAKQAGEEIDESEFELAVTVLAAQAFMQAGLSAEEAMDKVDQLTGDGAHIRASLKDGELSVTIERLDEQEKAE